MLSSRLVASAALAVVLLLGLAPAVLAAHPVFRSGSGSIPITTPAGPSTWFGYADLDRGKLSCTGACTSGIDVDYARYSSPTRRRLETEFGIKRMASRPTYAQCASATLTLGSYGVSANIGRWFCIETNRGRFGRLRINGFNVGPPDRLNVTYTVWCKPSDAC